MWLASPKPNTPPTVVSTPITQAVVGKLYGYDIVAVDKDFDVITFSQGDLKRTASGAAVARSR